MMIMVSKTLVAVHQKIVSGGFKCLRHARLGINM